MIKDVLQSITHSGNTEKTSALSGQNGGQNPKNAQPGLFGKMLQAFGQVEGNASQAKGLGVAVQMEQENTGEESASGEENPLLKLRVVDTGASAEGAAAKGEAESSKQTENGEAQNQEELTNENSELSSEESKQTTEQPLEISAEQQVAEGEQKVPEETQKQAEASKEENVEEQKTGAKVPGDDNDSTGARVNEEDNVTQLKENAKGNANVRVEPEGKGAEKAAETVSGKNITATGNTEAAAGASAKMNGEPQMAHTGNAETSEGNTKMRSAKTGEASKNIQAGVAATQQTKPDSNGNAIFKEQPVQTQNGKTETAAPEADMQLKTDTKETGKSISQSPVQAESANSQNRAKRPEQVLASRRFTDQKLTGMASQSQPGNQQQATESTQPARSSAPVNEDAAKMQQMKMNKGGASTEIHAQLSQMKSEESREKRYGFNSTTNTAATGSTDERLAAVMGSSTGSQNSAGNSAGNPGSFNGWMAQNSPQKGEGLSAEQEAFLKDKIMDSSEMKESGRAEGQSQSQAQVRLGELPIANTLLRRSVMPGLTAAMQKATSSSQTMTETWQKHSFELDNGQKIDMSTRNVDGVIHVKLASSNSDLMRLMQQYGSEIKDHLEQECEIQIDLQFDGEQEEEMSGFFGDSLHDGQGGTGRFKSAGNATNSNQKAEQTLQQSVRKFGYNRMEWTV